MWLLCAGVPGVATGRVLCCLWLCLGSVLGVCVCTFVCVCVVCVLCVRVSFVWLCLFLYLPVCFIIWQGNLGWAYMQLDNFEAAEFVYRWVRLFSLDLLTWNQPRRLRGSCTRVVAIS